MLASPRPRWTSFVVAAGWLGAIVWRSKIAWKLWAVLAAVLLVALAALWMAGRWRRARQERTWERIANGENSPC